MAIKILPWLCIMSVLFAHLQVSASEEGISDPNQIAKYVAINIEIKELQQAGSTLKDASENLRKALTNATNNIENLSPEQLQQINQLAQTALDLSESLNNAIESVPHAIKKAEDPAIELLNRSLQEAKAETVDPIIQTINRWILITIIGLIIICMLLAAITYLGGLAIQKMGAQIRRIADGYRIIPVEQYQPLEKTVPANTMDSGKSHSAD